jgi:hypothetical protein
MLPEMKYIEGELLPMLRERAAKHEQSAQKQLRQWRGEKGVCSLLLSVTDLPEMQALPVYDNEEIHYDPQKMFVSELRKALSTALADGDAVPSVRANVGCGALCTLLGGLKQSFFPDKMPWLLEHLSAGQLKELTVNDIEESPEFKAGLEQMKYMKEMLEGTGISLYPMDLQGPIDMAHLLMGNEFFYALYDDPDIVHHALELSVACDVYGMEKSFGIIQPEDYVCHYNGLVLPAETPLKVSEDTSTLISAEHLEEFMVPYTEKLLERFGGGYIHYCGSNKHLLRLVPAIKKNIGLNFGNPERHDPKTVLETLGQRGQCYFGSFPDFSAQDQINMARRENGSFNAFITVSCTMEEQARVLDSFNKVLNGSFL